MPDKLIVAAALISLAIVLVLHQTINKDARAGRGLGVPLSFSLFFFGLPLLCCTSLGLMGLRGDYGESIRNAVLAVLAGIGIFGFGYWCGVDKAKRDAEKRQKEEHDRLWYERHVREEGNDSSSQARDSRSP
jgi:hypothetical protein